MRNPAILPVGLLGFVLSAPVLAAASHCSGDESVVFNCPAGDKIASLCASKDLGKSAGYLQYRFGPKAGPELVVPPAKTHPDAAIKSGTLTFSGGGGAYLRFSKEGYDYVVYTAIGKGWGVKEGVAVEKNGKPAANVKCTKAAESKLGPEFFEQVGLAADNKEFDLP